MKDITFSMGAWEQYLSWQQLDRKTLKRINDLLKDMQRGGAAGGNANFVGIGKPEPLRHRKCWSRRIDHANRLVYTIDEEQNIEEQNITVVSCKGHYED